jgi:hypothetical protein
LESYAPFILLLAAFNVGLIAALLFRKRVA